LIIHVTSNDIINLPLEEACLIKPLRLKMMNASSKTSKQIIGIRSSQTKVYGKKYAYGIKNAGNLLAITMDKR
jgi:hypothetical protein